MKKVRIGNQTAFSASTPEEPFEYAMENGFDAFEWFPDRKEDGKGWDEDDIDKEKRFHIKKKADEFDIALSVHAPWDANPLQNENRGLFAKEATFTQDIGASLLNIHFYPDEGISAYINSIMPVIKMLINKGIRLSIENTVETGPKEFNDLFRHLNKIMRPREIDHIGMCLDIGHANLCGTTKNDYLRFIDMLEPHVKIIHIHVHENYGDSDRHLPLFSGPAGKDDSGIREFIERMKKRNFSGSIILEQWPEPLVLLKNARDRLYEIVYPSDDTMENEIHHAPHKKSDPDRIVQDRAFNGDFADKLIEADRKARSWREKLVRVHDLVTDEKNEIDAQKLAYLAVYLRFLGTGQILTHEEGGHHRPSHHATLSRHIHDRLLKVANQENNFIIRKIYPWLPSFEAPFLRSEPLTRIRDIAHRNDIPQELKREIKHTLQNKLHRNAGPEDLVTSEKLLKRITARDTFYPEAFVEEFRIFHEELKEFFNAGSLEEILGSLAEKGIHTRVANNFLKTKRKADSFRELSAVLDGLTKLRKALLSHRSESSGSDVQQLHIADIKLEDFSFVLFSKMINILCEQEEFKWDDALLCSVLTVENLRLSGMNAEECEAIESEFKIWSRGFDFNEQEQLIRLKSTVDRCRRLSETYCNRILKLFPAKAERLGRALGVAEHAVRVFSEADIRSHPVFQLSKLADILSRKIRNLASLPEWDVIVPGKTVGLLVATARLDDLTVKTDEPLLVILKRVNGEEEIPAGVAGIIAMHEIPHLSHLAIRARQNRVVFASCEDVESIGKLKERCGQRLSLDVREGKVSIKDLQEEETFNSGMSVVKKSIVLPEVSLSSGNKLLNLNEAKMENAGGKAWSARLLEEISGRDGSGFETPVAFVIPFGVMEKAIDALPEFNLLYRELLKRADNQIELDSVSMKLQEIVGQLAVPHNITEEITQRFAKRDRLIVRSSSNSEDLKELTGAGIYESVCNVQSIEVASAIRKVWSSLWSKRALMSRRQSGIPHDKVFMAVLVQKMFTPELSFVMHTVNPLNNNHEEAYVEMAVGMGEILTSGTAPGIPYRMICNKNTQKIKILNFASFSHSLYPDKAGGLVKRTVDYSMIEFSNNTEVIKNLGIRLSVIARFVENAFGAPQDIEGVIIRDDIYLVQSRPQMVSA